MTQQGNVDKLPKTLQRELKKRLSLIRLSKTGFFQKACVDNFKVEPDLVLWRKVLDKALIDSFSSHKEIKWEVEEWLDLNNEDFLEVCDLAMLEPEGVYAAFEIFKNVLKGDNARFKGFSNNAE